MKIWPTILIILAILLPFLDLAIGIYLGIFYQHYEHKLRGIVANKLSDEVRDGK